MLRLSQQGFCALPACKLRANSTQITPDLQNTPALCHFTVFVVTCALFAVGCLLPTLETHLELES